MDAEKIYKEVNERYGSIAHSTGGQHAHNVAKSFGYTEEELANVPEGANLGLSCGNPFSLAKLRDGEIVVDLGSGAGFDVFSAAKKIGRSGLAIGVDMNKDMLTKANANATKAGVENVRFVESPITAIDLEDSFADCIISNCVINLVPAAEKQLVFSEMFRLLKPGGRIAISDVLARKELTRDMRESIALYVGCIAGASQISDYEMYLQNAGFEELLIIDGKHDLNIYSGAAGDDITGSCCRESKKPESTRCCDLSRKDLSGTAGGCHMEAQDLACCSLEKKSSCCAPAKPTKDSSSVATVAKRIVEPEDIDWNEWAGSFYVYAIKPNV